MNEELERIVQGLFNGAELDSYDKDLIRRIILEQQKEIETLKVGFKSLGNVADSFIEGAEKIVDKLDVIEDELLWALRTGDDSNRDAYIKNALRFIREAMEMLK